MTAPLTRAGRRAEQRRRRRQQQVRLISAAVGVLVLLAAAFAVYLAKDAPEPPGDDGPGPRTQRTLLLQVQAADRTAAASVLLAHDPADTTGAAVLVPPQVLVNVPGTGSVPLGRALTTSPQGARDALSDLMGVTVDQGWVLTVPGLTRLVDALGGVQADVDVQVLRGQAVVITPGNQELDGARAAAFLTYLAPGEQEQSRLARVQEVLDGVIDALPATAPEVVAVLRGLGDGSTSTAELPDLAALLVGLAEDSEADSLQYDVLPVIDVDPGGGVTVFRADTPAVTALVDRLLKASVPPGVREGGNRVLVLNGVGTPGLGDAVRAKLVPAGFVFVSSQNADRFGYTTTQVLVPEATVEAQQLGERVAKALGLPNAPVGTQEFGTVADVVVLVGSDFEP